MMSRHTARFFALFLLLVSVPLRGENGWLQLTLGMSAEETVAVLGRPLMRTMGRGFETWTYDNGAEVLFYGTLMGWTAPKSSTVAKRVADVWEYNATPNYAPTFASLLPARVDAPSAARTAAGAPGRGEATRLPTTVTYRAR